MALGRAVIAGERNNFWKQHTCSLIKISPHFWGGILQMPMRVDTTIAENNIFDISLEIRVIICP